MDSIFKYVDIVDAVFAFLGATDLIKCRLVSKLFASIYQDEDVWKRLFLRRLIAGRSKFLSHELNYAPGSYRVTSRTAVALDQVLR
jgi:hypothetical protein